MINNLECTGCDLFDVEVFYRRSDGPPDCPDCGSERKMSFKGLRYAIHGQGHGSFVPVDFGTLGKAEKRFPGHRVQIDSENPQKWQQRTDERLHKQWERRKARGNDAKMVDEIATDRRRVRHEKAKQPKAPQPKKVKNA